MLRPGWTRLARAGAILLVKRTDRHLTSCKLTTSITAGVRCFVGCPSHHVLMLIELREEIFFYTFLSILITAAVITFEDHPLFYKEGVKDRTGKNSGDHET